MCILTVICWTVLITGRELVYKSLYPLTVLTNWTFGQRNVWFPTVNQTLCVRMSKSGKYGQMIFGLIWESERGGLGMVCVTNWAEERDFQSQIFSTHNTLCFKKCSDFEVGFFPKSPRLPWWIRRHQPKIFSYPQMGYIVCTVMLYDPLTAMVIYDQSHCTSSRRL